MHVSHDRLRVTYGDGAMDVHVAAWRHTLALLCMLGSLFHL